MFPKRICPARRPKSRWATAIAISLIVPLFLVARQAVAQSSDEMEALKSEIQALKAGQAAIRQDLAAIKQLLQQGKGNPAVVGAEAFEPTELSIAKAAYLGDAEAPVTLVEFTDYQCPYCRRHSLQTKPRLVKDYVETGKLRYVAREFPIESIHPHAFRAAEAALCAGDQGKYWDMGELLFQNQRRLPSDQLIGYADRLGLDMTSFKDCFESERYAERVRKDFKEGAAAGVRGTPSFFLGLSDPEDPSKIRATKVLRGAQSFAAFKKAIDELLAESAKGS